jgi:hypothetical protein
LGRYAFRRVFASSSITLHSAEFYKVDQRMIRPFSIAGKVAYSGENAGEGIARVAFGAPAIGDISPMFSIPQLNGTEDA